jgi:glyoxylase-like metal-dependent hydrolase (beta-lactamase superfamily II)
MSARAYLCFTCGTQFPPSGSPPAQCPICEDDRQWVPASGQRWTDLDELREYCRNEIRPVEDHLHSIVTKPAFAIGQRAYLLQTSEGNVLWDCIALLDPETMSALWALGGISAIAISHPHYYTTMTEWSRAFGGVPVYLHVDDRKWVQREDPAIQYWGGETKPLLGGTTLIRCGGHFPGGTVLCSPDGLLLAGDVIQVAPGRKGVSFMYSYPNFIPLNAAAVRRIERALEPYAFEKIYGAFGHVIERDGKAVLRRSVERYLRAIS